MKESPPQFAQKVDATEFDAACGHACGDVSHRRDGSRRLKQEIEYTDPESVKDPLSYWRRCDQLTVVQAALLILGFDPSAFLEGRTVLGTGQMEPTEPVDGYEATLSALANAILAGTLPAKIRSHARPWSGYADYPDMAETRAKDVRGVEIIYQLQPSWSLTTVSVEDLRYWLKKRGASGGFFFPDREPTIAEYLNPENGCYAPKLAAGLDAWRAVSTDPNLRKKKSAKQALDDWLTQEASRYELLKPDGSINRAAIEDIAKVANWDLKGGAPRT